jgi:nucleoside-diphosphate-sugar epimerase
MQNNGHNSANVSPAVQGAIVGFDERILITGAAGFIGARVLELLVDRGFRNLRCLVRPTGNRARLEAIQKQYQDRAQIEIVNGNLLSREDCRMAVKEVSLIYHLAAGRGEKLVADAFMNSVVTTRNLLEACHEENRLKRFVTVSSFSVYSNREKPNGRLLDESSPMDARPELRSDAYTFAKVKQDELVMELGAKWKIPYVIVRPGVVYGPGNEKILGRVGINTFGVFLHLGGSNPFPLTYVENCADAIVLAGLVAGVEGEAFNVVDDELPSCRRFLKLYKRKVKRFRSIYVPHAVSYTLCYLWEKYSHWSQGQLPPVYGRATWHAYWKKTRYSNRKLKDRLGWKPRVPAGEALDRFFESCRARLGKG